MGGGEMSSGRGQSTNGQLFLLKEKSEIQEKVWSSDPILGGAKKRVGSWNLPVK